MTSHVVVVHSSARTAKIPTVPTKYLTDVRDEACKKFNVKAEQYTLKFNNKPISLSQQIRLANLPQGARLELVQASRSPTVISVALQLPASENNKRLTQKFASNTSLWEILRQFESGNGANYNFTQRGVPEMKGSSSSGAGRLNYEMPIITVMPAHREQSDFVGLQQTLSQLGFDSGSALLKLSFKNSGQPLEEAMTQITQYFQSSEATASGAHATAPAQLSSLPDPDKVAPEASEVIAGQSIKNDPTELMDIDSKPEAGPVAVESTSTPTPVPEEVTKENVAPAMSQSLPTPTSTASSSSHPPGSFNNVQIYSAPTSSTPQAAKRQFNEQDYVPTIEHAKAHQAALSSQTRNQRLLSDKELEEQEAEKLEKVNAAAEKGGQLRIRMPDQTMIQMGITKAHTADELYDFVRQFLQFKDQPFELRFTGPQGRPVAIERGSKRLIQDLRFSGREVVTFVWDENASNEAKLSRKTLSKEWQDQAQTLKIQEVSVDEKPGTVSQSPAAEGKRKVGGQSPEDKESKLKNILSKGLFKKR